MPNQSLSIILPTYNEGETICKLVEKILSVLSAAQVESEILVVDDSSPDGTADIVRRTFLNDSIVHTISRNAPRSLGASIKDGILAAHKDMILMMDADFNHSPDDIPRFLACVGDADLINGSRFIEGGGMEKAQARFWGSYFFNLICRFILALPITDVLSGFILADREKLLSLKLDKIFSGYGDFAIRLHNEVKQKGWKTKEVSVRYLERLAGRSKTRFLKHTWQYSMAALKTRFFNLDS